MTLRAASGVCTLRRLRCSISGELWNRASGLWCCPYLPIQALITIERGACSPSLPHAGWGALWEQHSDQGQVGRSVNVRTRGSVIAGNIFTMTCLRLSGSSTTSSKLHVCHKEAGSV